MLSQGMFCVWNFLLCFIFSVNLLFICNGFQFYVFMGCQIVCVCVFFDSFFKCLFSNEQISKKRYRLGETGKTREDLRKE